MAWRGLPWLLALHKPGVGIGKGNVATAFRVMTLAMLLLFLLKVVNCHFPPKIGSFGEVSCGI